MPNGRARNPRFLGKVESKRTAFLAQPIPGGFMRRPSKNRSAPVGERHPPHETQHEQTDAKRERSDSARPYRPSAGMDTHRSQNYQGDRNRHEQHGWDGNAIRLGGMAP